jgi:hypothetical protein
MIPFWCLMPKGEKLRPKQEMDQSYHLRTLKIVELEVLICQNTLPLENFENSRVRSFDSSKYSKCLFLLKVGLL